MNLLDDDALLDLGGRRGPRDDAARPADASPRTGTGPDAAPDSPGPTGQAEAGVCHMCKRPANRACKSCDRPVCAADSWVMFGLCRACASEDRVKRWNSQQQATGGNWLEEA